jgi:hypothetical protein
MIFNQRGLLDSLRDWSPPELGPFFLRNSAGLDNPS